MRVRSWQYLLVGVVCAAAQLLLPRGLTLYVVYLLIGGSGIVAMVVGIRANKPTNRLPWVFVAAGYLAWLLGDLIYNWSVQIQHLPRPEDVTDFSPYVLAYLLLASGLLLLVRGRNPGRQPTALLDAAILTVGLGLASWVFLVIPGWEAAGLPLLDRLIAIVYPLCDVLLVATGIRLVTGAGFWNSSSRLLVGSFIVLLATNGTLQRAQFVPEIAAQTRLLDSGWLLAYVLAGAAALHPSMRALSKPAPEREDTMLVGRLVAISGAVLTCPGIIAGQLITGAPLHPWPIVVAATILIALVLTRMVRMVGQLRSQGRRLSALTETDYVTGMANRRGFAVRIDEHFAAAGAGADLMLLVGIERFGDLTSTLGLDTGDSVLGVVGQRLSDLVGPRGLVARMGEDTFGVLEPAPCSDVDGRAVQIRDALGRPYVLPDLSVSVEVSLGVVVLPDDAATPALALHRAGVALVGAKSRPGRIARYASEMETGGAFAAQLIGELRGALGREEIVLHYQPQVELGTGRVLGVEALARWQHPVHGLLGPDAFIPAAEQTGLIGPFTHYVLDRSLEQCARWRRDGLELTVAVNLSVRNLLDPELLEDVRFCLARHDLPASVLELEITEGTAMVDPNRSLEVLGELAALGIMLSIDDYGTGHSSLAYLQRLPVGRLKIDRSFVTDLTRDDDSATIVRSTIELAGHLRLDVIAEGVEDDITLLALRDMQCRAAQGFGLGRPVPAGELPGLVRRIEERVPGLVRVSVSASSPASPGGSGGPTPRR